MVDIEEIDNMLYKISFCNTDYEVLQNLLFCVQALCPNIIRVYYED